MKRVLIVDDEPSIREIMAQVLEEEGYVVQTATSGISLLGLLETSRPDLILLDLLMPDGNGTDVLQVLRSESNWCDISVVIVSTGIAFSRVEAPNIPFVEKPFTLEKLLQVVEDTIGRA